MEETKNVVTNENFDWNAYENDLGVYDHPKEEIAEAYDKTLSNVNVGEVVEGTVTGITKREVLVNIGYKSEGVIPVSEFRYNPDLKVGDKIEVYVESAEDKGGQLVLSHKKARQLKSWDRVNEALEKDEIIKGYIKCRTKGGMIVDVFGIEAFLPGSQIDVKPIRDYDVYVDKTMEFKVVKINQEFRNVVVSHKALIEAELEAQKQVIMSKLEKGQILEGTVKNITSYGVFVDLGGVDGLIHITDLSWGRVNHPEEIVQLDQKLKVDDPVGAVGVHCINGALGTILTGLFAYYNGTEVEPLGVFYGGGFHFFGIQVLGVVAVIAWVAITMTIVFNVIKHTIGLRVSEAEEIMGLDKPEHGLSSAYADFMPVVPTVLGTKAGETAAKIKDTIPVAVEKAVPVTKVTTEGASHEHKLSKIVIIAKQSKFEVLKEALASIGVSGMTVTNVVGCGVQKGAPEYYRGAEVDVTLLPKLKMEVVVSKVPVETVVETVKKVLYTGHIGDGKIFVYDVENVVKVRTGAEGFDALQDDN